MRPIDPAMLARIQRMRLMDDDFMTVVFSGDNRLTELLLSILLGRNDLRVKSSMTQRERRNLFGRSVRLDIVAEDEEGKVYNVEIQRADEGASPRRARYHAAMLDSHMLKKGDAFSELPETYIIFIAENDHLGRGMPLYRVEKHFNCNGDYLPFDDGCTIIYVNGAYRGDDAIGRLMRDFSEPSADKMHYGELAERVRLHKQETKGIDTMCRIVEEYGDERVELRNIEFAESLLRNGRLSAEEIADIAKVPLERVKQMAEQLAAPAQA